jgi:hypothetical protein
MCNSAPEKVSIARQSATLRAASELGLMSNEDIKKFVGDGIQEPVKCAPSTSDLFPGTRITAYKFVSGRKNCYLAFHRSKANKEWIHIKSLHLDDTNPSLGTFGDLLGAINLGGNDE